MLVMLLSNEKYLVPVHFTDQVKEMSICKK